MAFQNLPIKRKVMAVIMLTSVVALLLTTTAFMVYDFLSYRQTLVRTLSTTSSIIADESTAALAFKNESDAQQILGALKADSHIVAAALYDELGRLYVRYPPETPISGFPPEPGQTGFHFEPGYVTYFQPVVEKSGWLGTLYLKSDVLALYERLRLYGGIALLVLFGSVLVALAISTALQRRITEPILALAHSARLVSERGDYSVRAPKISGDELGLLTDAFNLMLTRIEEQTVALKESEEQLRLALEASRTGTWVWNVAAGKITADIRSQRLFGRKPVVFRGVYEEFIELLHPEDRDRVKTDVAEALKRKEEYFAEFRVVWPDGTVHYLAARGRGLYDSAGQPVRMSGVVLDVTESKEVERAVRESEARKSAILESAIDCIITMDEEGRIVDFNPAAERVFGYRRDEVIGQPLAEKIIPERLRAAHWQGLARLKDGGPSLILGRRIEMRAMRSDKTEFPVELAISSTALHGRGLFFTAYVRDISERKRAEEALSFLAAIVESSDDAVVGKNLESKVISWNAGAERMFGYSAVEMLGQPITRLLSPERPDEEEAIRDEVKQGETRHFETLRIRRDGLPIDVSLTVSPIKNTRGEIIGVSSIARDITERKRAQAALEKQAAILSEQAQMLELANVMARDLTDQIILWNTGMEKMYGWTKKEALGTIAH